MAALNIMKTAGHCYCRQKRRRAPLGHEGDEHLLRPEGHWPVGGGRANGARRWWEGEPSGQRGA